MFLGYQSHLIPVRSSQSIRSLANAAEGQAPLARSAEVDEWQACSTPGLRPETSDGTQLSGSRWAVYVYVYHRCRRGEVIYVYI